MAEQGKSDAVGRRAGLDRSYRPAGNTLNRDEVRRTG